jgi:DNA helicase-2/ATP-dependent DNA helicase PcrA
MTIDLSRFTASQREAIEYRGGNLQLIAGAGAGKTEVLACRVARLLDDAAGGGLLPSSIVAFTFQEKAAAELKQRIARRVEQQVGDIPGLAEMFVGTIHGFCLELLKDEIPKYLKYSVLGEVQQKLLINRNSAKSGLTTSEDLKGNKLRRYIDTNNYTGALDILRESEISWDMLDESSLLGGLSAYNALLDEHAYLDYPAMMERAVKLLENDEELRTSIQTRVREVIVDEYQDVNPVQERLVRALHDLGATICVIGDDDQTIHQWRGSNVNNILTFKERYSEVHRIELGENFRSTDGIVETARQFIEQNAERLPKTMSAMSSQTFERGDISALHFESPDHEAGWIAEQIKTLRGVSFVEEGEPRGLTYSDIAILFRSVRRNAEPVTNALTAAGIPFVVSGMNNLFGTREAEAARQLFYLMATRGNGQSPIDRADVERAWSDADLGIEPECLEKALDAVQVSKEQLSSDEQGRWGIYSIQRVFLDFIEECQLREEGVPGGRGEVVFYNLGKFSQLISDFEQIHFKSRPDEKYDTFADFLLHQADGAYDEGWLDKQYASPDAVRIMTVHQAKGMQWPAVFVPALLRNRFPSAKPTGKSVWHLLPREAVVDQERYDTSTEDERRLFYVAITRSQKFLAMTHAPIEGYGNRYVKPSVFWTNVLASPYVLRREPNLTQRPRTEPKQRAGVSDVVLSFSDLKYFFECPYQFKLRILYGFNRPIVEALGYGKSLHDALAELHGRIMEGDTPDSIDVRDLVERNLHLPFAYPELEETLEKSAHRVLTDYIEQNRDQFDELEYFEKKVELSLEDGITIVGRIDLVRRANDEGHTTSIIDFKTNDRSQAEDVTEMQLHTYVLGYEALTGEIANLVETYELDEGQSHPRAVDPDFVKDVKEGVINAASALRADQLEPAPTLAKCSSCDFLRMCSKGTAICSQT